MGDSLAAEIEDCERSMLGSLLMSTTGQSVLLAETRKILDGLPISGRTKTILDAAESVLKRAGQCDLVPLRMELSARGCLDTVGGIQFIGSLSDVACIGQPEHYARELRRYYRTARKKNLAAVIANKTAKNEPLNGELEEFQSLLKSDTDGEESWAEPISLSALISMKLPPIRYCINPLASIGNLTQIQGEPKKGKSAFALYCAISTAAGVWCADRWTVDGAFKTLLVTYEDGMARVQKRASLYLQGLGYSAPPGLDIYTHDTAPLLRLEKPEGRDMAYRILRRGKYELAIFDTLSHLHGAEENSRTEMQPVLDALKNIARDVKCAIVVLHHAGKPKQQTPTSAVYRGRGSSAIAAADDVILDWGDRGDTNVTPCWLTSKDDDEDKFQVVYAPDDASNAVRWRLEDQETKEEGDLNRARVLQSVIELSKTAPQGASLRLIAEAAGLKHNSTRSHLNNLHKSGNVQLTIKGQTKLYYPSTS